MATPETLPATVVDVLPAPSVPAQPSAAALELLIRQLVIAVA
jgi:hypothetical protein